MRSMLLNGGAYSRTAFQAINKTATAAGSGDATEVDCSWVSRKGPDGDLSWARSAKLVITYTATLQGGETLKFALNMQDATSSAGAGAADYGDALAATTVATGESGGSTETGTAEVDVDLSGAKEFIRAQITPDLSAGGTDTCEWSACLVLYGPSRQPTSLKLASVVGA